VAVTVLCFLLAIHLFSPLDVHFTIIRACSTAAVRYFDVLHASLSHILSVKWDDGAWFGAGGRCQAGWPIPDG
jgi:hypothetical protein